MDLLDRLAAIDRAALAVLKATNEPGSEEVRQKVERRSRRRLNGLTRLFMYNVWDDLRWDALGALFDTNAKMGFYALAPGLAGSRVGLKGNIASLVGQVPFIETDLFVDQIDDMLREGYVGGYNAGGGWASRMIAPGGGVDFQLRDPNILNAIRGRSRWLSGHFERDMTDGLTDWLEHEMFVKGSNPLTARRYLRGRGWNDVARWRVDRVARTESLIAVEHGKFDTAQRSGVTHIEWQSHLDANTRPSHVGLDGQTIEIGKTFSNGLRYPGDPAGRVEEIVNCRCTSAPVTRHSIERDAVWTGL